MPKGDPRDNAQKKRIEQYNREKFVTPKQFEKLSWNHLDQIGKYNKTKQRKPKPGGDPSKSYAEHQRRKKGKQNEKFK